MADSGHRAGRSGFAALAALILLYLASVSLRSPAERFGMYHDDTLYAAAARAIADGQGYVQPNLPGTPPATKYPPGYPYALAFAMTLAPATYAEPAGLWALSAAAGAWALIVAFFDLRRWKGVSWKLAAGSVALCSLHEIFLRTSGALLSDALFMALALTACLLADQDQPSKVKLFGSVIFAGLAVATRTIGFAVVGGISAAYLLRQGYRRTATFCLAVAPFGLLAVYPKLVAPPLTAQTEGFRQTLLYYTDYAAFWRVSVPDAETLLAMLYANLGNLLRAPAELTLGGAPSMEAAKLAWMALTVAIAAGIIRQARRDRWRPIHLSLAFSLPVVLAWNFEITTRSLLIFAPLFSCGLWVECGHVTKNLLRTAKKGNPTPDRVFSAAFLVLLACLALLVVYRTGRAHILMASQEVESYDAKYADLFAWMRANTDPQDRFIATDDGMFYLRTGRQGMWPLALTTEPRFRPDAERLEKQLELLPDVAEEIGACYVIQADHDYAYAPIAQERWLEWTADLPVLAENADGSARILDLGCRPSCGDPALTELADPRLALKRSECATLPLDRREPNDGGQREDDRRDGRRAWHRARAMSAFYAGRR